MTTQMSIQFKTGFGLWIEVGLMKGLSEHKRRLAIVVVAFATICCCSVSAMYRLAIQPIPSRAQLCGILHEQIDRSRCIDLPNAINVVNEAFHTGVTTRQEVQNLLGEYQEPEPYDGLDFYRLDGNWLTENLDFPDIYFVFDFDENDRLQSITVEE